MTSNGYTISPALGRQHQIVRDCAQARSERAFQLLRQATARLFEASGPRLRKVRV